MNLHVHKLDGTRASRVYTAKPYRFTKADTHFVETVANLGAVALEHAIKIPSGDKIKQNNRSSVGCTFAQIVRYPECLG